MALVQFPGSKLKLTEVVSDKLSSSSSTGNVEIANYTKLSANPRFRVTLSGDQALTASLATVAFDTEAFDVGTAHSAGVFTAPVTGVYFFAVHLRFTGITAAEVTEEGTFKVNADVTANSIYKLDMAAVDVSGEYHVNGSMIIALTAADTVAVQVKSAATNASVAATGSHFEGMLISTT
jgi:hypothetical protein